MRLWSEYEGTTIADAYPIEKLIRPEGRSAFFSTSNGTGTPAVIRLIESINDEGEILNRWRTVSELHETHLITLKKFGQTIFEGTPLIYVLMEKSEADLAGILKQGTLSVEDTREIAISLVDAVGKLHGAGIVHEHIEPINVLAAGEVVKLRSDCIREAPEGEEGAALRQQDVQDIAVVLLQALTQRKSLDAIGATRVPAPFDAIIRNGISGKWGLAQIAAALNPPVAKVVAASTPGMPETQGMSTAKATEAAKVTEATSAPTPAAAKSVAPPAAEAAKSEQMSLKLADAPPPASHVEAKYVRDRITIPIDNEEEAAHKRWWVVGAPAAVVLLIALGWYSFRKPAPANEAAKPITTLTDKNAAPANPVPAAPAAATVPQPVPAAGEEVPHWKVIAFTYNHQDQAQHKVDELKQKDASLQPEVFSPHAGAGYLVTVGGTMTRSDAAAFRRKAQAEGLPRDTYIQNYGDHPRHRR